MRSEISENTTEASSTGQRSISSAPRQGRVGRGDRELPVKLTSAPRPGQGRGGRAHRSQDQRGDASVNGEHAVDDDPKAAGRQHHRAHGPHRRLDRGAATSLPPGARLEGDLFKQSRFIEASIANVVDALRDGAIMVAVVLFLFLVNPRTTAITLVAIPLSLLVSAIVFKLMGLGINTMTLGGLAVAIGELVDDAIVDVENVFRRLRENRAAGGPKSSLRVVYDASSEVRNSIVFSTVIVVLVFLPLFALGGIEGRLFAPLGVAYIVSLLASLAVSLTVTPALCSYLLPGAKAVSRQDDGAFVRRLKRLDLRLLERTIRHPKPVLAGCLVLLASALALLPSMGRNFLPDFNEGTATIGIAAAPGISLAASDALGTRIEEVMLAVPEVKSRSAHDGGAGQRRASIEQWTSFQGRRAPRDVVLKIREKWRRRETSASTSANRSATGSIPARRPRSDRVRSRGRPDDSRLGVSAPQDVHGVVDLASAADLIPNSDRVDRRRRPASVRPGIRPGPGDGIERGAGRRKLEQAPVRIFIRLDDKSRHDAINAVLVMLPGRVVTVGDLAPSTGHGARSSKRAAERIVISANTHGRDLGRIVQEIHQGGRGIHAGGYSSRRPTKTSKKPAAASLPGTVPSAFFSLTSLRSTVPRCKSSQHPAAASGRLAHGRTPVAATVAFITLGGIASRNGIMMISHYIRLMKEEGEAFGEAMVVRGSLERLVPVLMTALTAALALVHILLSRGEPGKEILHPVAVVIVGGLLSSTLLDISSRPACSFGNGRRNDRWKKKK